MIMSRAVVNLPAISLSDIGSCINIANGGGHGGATCLIHINDNEAQAGAKISQAVDLVLRLRKAVAEVVAVIADTDKPVVHRVQASLAQLTLRGGQLGVPAGYLGKLVKGPPKGLHYGVGAVKAFIAALLQLFEVSPHWAKKAAINPESLPIESSSDIKSVFNYT